MKLQDMKKNIFSRRLNFVIALPAEAKPIIHHFGLKRDNSHSLFKTYRSQDSSLWLVISGVGKDSAATSTEFLATVSEADEKTAWLNVGIAGQKDLPVGTSVLADKITDPDTDQTWYPLITFTPFCKTASIKTVLQHLDDYPTNDVYEMEAAGFYSTASQIASPELVHVLKVVSDNFRSSVEEISGAKVENLIKDKLEVIKKTVFALCTTRKTDYSERFASFSKQGLYQSLDTELQIFIQEIGYRYNLSFQELRQIVEIAIDFSMWGELSLPEQWSSLEQSINLQGRSRKERLIRDLKDRWLSLREQETIYSGQKKSFHLPSNFTQRKHITREGNQKVFGMCPVASEKTICCNLRTIDAVQGCGLACSYCSIQTFYDPTIVAVEGNLSKKLQNTILDPHKNYHICSGQSSDSLILGNKNGILKAQFEFAIANPNIFLELKTKSKNITYLLDSDVPRNIVVSWSLNPQIVIDYEEHLTASEIERLIAARKAADRGIHIGFHFHPILHYRGWKNDYLKLIRRVLSMFSNEEVVFVSFGTLTFIKPAIKSLRLKGIPSKVLQIPMEETAGKFSYPNHIKEELFNTVWAAFQPWHDTVFFYLCMEERKLWESVFGFCYNNNEEFEQDLFNHVSHKLNPNFK